MMAILFPENTAMGPLSPFAVPGTAMLALATKLSLSPLRSQAVPRERGRPQGYYEDFLTGFPIDPIAGAPVRDMAGAPVRDTGPTTWGRPVGLLVLPDDSLLLTDRAAWRQP